MTVQRHSELHTDKKTGYSLPLLDTDLAVAKQLFDVNVFALVAVTQAFAPLLIASKGTIVNIGSSAGVMPVPWQGYYNASKAAVAAISDNLRIELSPFGVKTINEISGAVKTKFFDNNLAQRLPPDSYYIAAREDIEPLMNGSSLGDNSWDADHYATEVVANALKSNPKVHHWLGGSAWIIC